MKSRPSLTRVAAPAIWLAVIAGAGWLWFRIAFRFDILAPADWLRLAAAWQKGWRIDSAEEWAFVASFPALVAVAACGVLAGGVMRRGLDAWRRRRWRRLAERDHFIRRLRPRAGPLRTDRPESRRTAVAGAANRFVRQAAPEEGARAQNNMANPRADKSDRAADARIGAADPSSTGRATAPDPGDAYPVAQKALDPTKALDRDARPWPHSPASGSDDEKSTAINLAPPAPSSANQRSAQPATNSVHDVPAAGDAVAGARAWFAAAGYRIVANMVVDAVPDARADFVAVAGGDLLVVVVDDVGGDWLAEEAPDHPAASVWVKADGSSERPSPVARAAQLRQQLRARHGAALDQFRIRTAGAVVVVVAGSVLNADSCRDIWLRDFDVVVSRADAADADPAIPSLEDAVGVAADPASPDAVAYFVNASRRDGDQLRNAAGGKTRIVDTKKKVDVT